MHTSKEQSDFGIEPTAQLSITYLQRLEYLLDCLADEAKARGYPHLAYFLDLARMEADTLHQSEAAGGS